MASHPDTKIDCSKVYVKRSSFATEDNEFDGAYAAVPIKKGSCLTFQQHCCCNRPTEEAMRTNTIFWLFYFFLLRPHHYYNSGELVEKGVMRRLPDGFDGNTCPYIFTWSTERPNKVWGMGSGCSAYYNTVRSCDGTILCIYRSVPSCFVISHSAYTLFCSSTSNNRNATKYIF